MGGGRFVKRPYEWQQLHHVNKKDRPYRFSIIGIGVYHAVSSGNGLG